MGFELPNGKTARNIQEQVAFLTEKVKELFAAVSDLGFKILAVEELPEEGAARTIYLVPSADPETENAYDEYIWTEDGWEKVGSTNIDLSNYYTKSETASAISEAISNIPKTYLHILYFQDTNYRITFNLYCSQASALGIDGLIQFLSNAGMTSYLRGIPGGGYYKDTSNIYYSNPILFYFDNTNLRIYLIRSGSSGTITNVNIDPETVSLTETITEI